MERRVGPPEHIFISPKTSKELMQLSYDDFSSQTDKNKTKAITDDIVQNARELASDIAWGEVLSLEKGKYDSLEVALPTRQMEQVVRKIEWGMSYPEVVFMSGNHFSQTLARRLTILTRNLSNTQRRFTDEEKKEKTIAAEESEHARLSVFKHKLSTAVSIFSKERLIVEPEYLQVLSEILYAKPRSRKDAIAHFIKGDSQTALKVLLKP